VDPALILDAKPGDLFVIRNVANIVPSFENLKENLNRFHSTAAGLELAVKKHQVESIVVLGHSKCGGIILSYRHQSPFERQ
jgi:carbonic anhydrase